MKTIHSLAIFISVLTFIACNTVIADEPVSSSDKSNLEYGGIAEELLNMPLEDLMNIEVAITSASKHVERAFETASAVYVLTQEDIRRSGASSIPEALRMVPGLSVSRVDSNKWAITSRGFNGRWANKLLVLVDGRSVYTPFFSGVYWSAQDTILEDIERIEVIRGPGATMWGANAVNGIINIITKNARNTQGTLTTQRVGTEDHSITQLRHGGTVGSNGYYRVYAKRSERDSLVYEDGKKGSDEWDQLRAGFRTDLFPSVNDQITISGDIYDGSEGLYIGAPSLTLPAVRFYEDITDISGGHITARWNKSSEKRHSQLQAYYDRVSRKDTLYQERRNTFDVEYHSRTEDRTHHLIWGLGYRQTSDNVYGGPNTIVNVPKQTDRIYSAFIQDDITLKPGKTRLILGTKYENNSYTGGEIQPNVRFLWTPDESHVFWSAISRAVRTPSRWERTTRANFYALHAPNGSVSLISAIGNEDFISETLIAYELGYRAKPTQNLSFDVTAFYNEYDDLRTYELRAPFFEASPPPAHMVIPLVMDNEMYGSTNGFELVAEWQPSHNWEISAYYSWLYLNLALKPGSTDAVSKLYTSDTPYRQFHIRSFWNIDHNKELDILFYSRSKAIKPEVGSFSRLDVRFGWRPTDILTLSVGGCNLFEKRHAEHDYYAQGGIATWPERSFYVKAAWEF